jgi:hypothetical protein
MESVYLETTFISYLVARPSRDLIVAGHQQITQEWWANRHSEFECRVSQVVVVEASVGDPAEVQKRLAISAACRLWMSRQTPRPWPRVSWLPASFRRMPFAMPRTSRWRLCTPEELMGG